MNLVNKQVNHRSFGKGSVVKYNDSYVEVHFSLGNKKFVFPDAFGKYLTLIDQRAATSVKRKIKQRKEEELELNKLKVIQREKQLRLMERQKLVRGHKTKKVHPNSQAVFWCTAQDRDRLFEEWSVFTGVFKSGDNKGQPRRLVRMNQNSACLLTARDPDMSEKDRYILGVYMVNEAFIGRLCEDGYIPAHSEFRLRLSEQESEKMLFWNYYVDRKHPHKMTWNTGRYRYFENIWLAQILREIVTLRNGTPEQESVLRFFEHFCQMNQISEEELSEPHGALMRE